MSRRTEQEQQPWPCCHSIMAYVIVVVSLYNYSLLHTPLWVQTLSLQLKNLLDRARAHAQVLLQWQGKTEQGLS